MVVDAWHGPVLAPKQKSQFVGANSRENLRNLGSSMPTNGSEEEKVEFDADAEWQHFQNVNIS